MSLISDAYFLASLYQERFKSVNTVKLTHLLYLLEGYYMCMNDEDRLYEEEFKFDMIRNM